MVNLKLSWIHCILDSMKYGINDWIFSALDNSEKKSSLLVMLLISNLFFFSTLFFLSQMDTNHIYYWTAIFLLENTAVDWNHFGWTKFPPVPAPEWLLPIPQIYLSGQSKLTSVCHAALHSTPSLSCWLPEKQRKSPGLKEASVCLWKRTICVSGKFYNNCAAKHVHSKAEQPPYIPVPVDL